MKEKISIILCVILVLTMAVPVYAEERIGDEGALINDMQDNISNEIKDLDEGERQEESQKIQDVEVSEGGIEDILEEEDGMVKVSEPLIIEQDEASLNNEDGIFDYTCPSMCTEEEWEVLRLTNKERAAYGLQPLTMYDQLQNVTDIRKKELLVQFSHVRPNGTNCFTTLSEAGIAYWYAAENIAAGAATPARAVLGWMNSPGHRGSILDREYKTDENGEYPKDAYGRYDLDALEVDYHVKHTHIGVGYIKDELQYYQNYWVQMFVGDCDITGITLSNSGRVMTINKGDSLDSLGLILQAQCSHGVSYLPVTEELCSGFDASLIGKEQTITVTCSGHTTSFVVKVQVPLQGISLEQSEITLEKGASDTLKVKYLPEDTTDSKVVKWESDNSDVVMVNSDGKITAVGSGSAIITATTSDGIAASCAVNLIVPIKSIYLNQSELVMNKGEQYTLKATIVPDDTTDSKIVNWTSSNSQVAEVERGKVIAISAGTAVITVTSENGRSATCKVTVNVPLKAIILDKSSITVNKGESLELKVGYDPEDTTDIRDVTWKSSNPDVATVKNGKVNAINNGSAIITVTSRNNKTAVCVIKVITPITGISLDQNYLTLRKGETANLKEKIIPETTTEDKGVIWTSSNSKVATVFEGKVLAISPGSAIITAQTLNGKTDICNVTVNIPLENITLNKESATLYVGADITLKVNYDPIDTTDPKTVIWSSSSPQVASVDNGKIIAAKEGKTVITARVGNKTAESKITVKSVNAVLNLKAAAAGKNRVKLTWLKAKDVEGYLIYAQKNGVYGYVGMTAGNTYTDTKVLFSKLKATPFITIFETNFSISLIPESL